MKYFLYSYMIAGGQLGYGVCSSETGLFSIRGVVHSVAKETNSLNVAVTSFQEVSKAQYDAFVDDFKILTQAMHAVAQAQATAEGAH